MQLLRRRLAPLMMLAALAPQAFAQSAAPIKVPSALLGAISLSLVATLVVGVLPHLVLDLADKATFARIPGL